KPNILFIAIDDMNDWVGFLGGHKQAKTPNMDRLAEKGVNFRNAHCPAPACSPCRNALLFGVQPFNSGLYPFYDNEKVDVEVIDKYTTLPQLFKESGYNTYGSGKIHHGREWTYHKNGGQLEWTENNQKTLDSLPNLVYDKEAGYVLGKSRKMAFCPTKPPLDDHPDYATAKFGIDVLKREHDKPFFLGLGFVKPHLPFVCPREYFDLHAGPISPPAIKSDDLSDVPWPGRGNAQLKDDLRYRKDKAWEKVRRSYLACISWTDANVGRVLDELEKSPWKDNTIVVLWSDHGYHLGEKRSFRKFSLWEEATRVPFIIWDSRETLKTGRKCDEPVSLIDIYSTLTEMAGLKAPDYLDGESLVPWLEEPDKQRKSPAITTWGRGNYTIRSKDWRYIRYFDGSEELYHSKEDVQEWNNLADDPKCAKKKEELRKSLPKKEAPLVYSGKALHNVVDADKPDLKGAKKKWNSVNAKINPKLD
ncbi:MAG: sulfatase, partial [Planctomycetota bacterium]